MLHVYLYIYSIEDCIFMFFMDLLCNLIQIKEDGTGLTITYITLYTIFYTIG